MKKRYLLLIGFLGLFVFVVCMSSVSAWYDTSWSHRKSITIDHAQVDEHLSNFPVLINITDSDLAFYAQSDFDDILFADVNDSKLAHQIEDFDSSTGLLTAWVNVTSVFADVNTTFYMYYGNLGCDAQGDPSGVWDNGFWGVYHMNETAGSTEYDSTSNGRNSVTTGVTFNKDGVVDGGDGFVYGDESRGAITRSGMSVSSYTVECFIKPDVDANEKFVWVYDDDFYSFIVLEGNSLSCLAYDGTGDRVGATLVDDIWYHVVFRVLENDYAYLFINGSFVDRVSINGLQALITNQHYIGSRDYIGIKSFNGVIDEFRISTVNRSDSWIKTNFNTLNNDSDGGFFSFGAREDNNIDINDSTNIRATSMVLNGYVKYGTNYTCGFWVGTNSSVNHSYNVQNVSVSGFYSNGESFSSSVTGLSPGTVYYVKAWAQNESGLFNSNYITVLLKPEAPTGVSASVVNKSAINISWTGGTGSNTTVVVRKSGSYPSSISDGSVLGNTSNSYLVVSGLSSGDVFYYRLWSYSNQTLANGSFLSQISDNNTDVVYAFLVVSVYDEATGVALNDWNITVSNIDGSSVYNSSNNNNPLSINTSLLPTGSVSVIVSCNNYEQRVYNLNIISNSFYILDAYLPKKNVSQLCRIDVVGSQTEYGANPPIEDAFVRVKEFDNESGIYQNVSTFYTDANGQFFIHLDINTQYIVVVNKSGYNTETSSFIVQSGVQVYTFRLSESSGVAQSWNIFHDVVSLSVTKYGNGSMYVYFVDGGGTTVDTDVFVYEIWNGSLSLNHSDSRSGSNGFGFWVSGLNLFRSHRVVLFFNNSLSFDVDSPYSVVVFPFYIAETHSFSFDDRMTNLIGPFMINDIVIGWHNLISIIVGLLVLVMFGPRNTGMGIIGCGLGIGLMNVLFTMWFTDSFPVLLITLTPLCILIGIVYLKSQPDGGAML